MGIRLISRVSNQNIQRAATGLLCELAADEQLAGQIDQEPGAMRQLANLLHCRNEAVATYAAATMHRLSEQKSDEDRKRMSMDLQKSLFNQMSNNEHGATQNGVGGDNNSTLGKATYQTTTMRSAGMSAGADDASRNFVYDFHKGNGSTLDQSHIDRQQT